MKRTVIKIDEALCNGCGACVSGCHEGALQLIDNKAVMISDLYCDGLGACIGECPVGAISFDEREAEPYSEEAVMERIAPKGKAVILAHLNHLKAHGEMELVRQGLDYLERHHIPLDFSAAPAAPSEVPGPPAAIPSVGGGCPGSMAREIQPTAPAAEAPLACGCPGSMAREIRPVAAAGFAPVGIAAPVQSSELRQFPVQLHLLNPQAGFLQNADLLLAADCTAFARGDFHSRFLKGKVLAIACPKLDSNTQSYIDKLAAMIDLAHIDTLTVLVMEVPCCGGLVKIAQAAREQATRNIPVKVVVLSVNGEIHSEEWI